ncbi:MAG: CoA transferase [Pelagimonas sp.]|jgi:crotonobetainyl-CoA:carnitine CoA-transferase CaiB-like acyl-CoA transferase|nr:CoA transferase [Pelagimonas sp.]
MLQGIRIIEFEAMGPAPFAGMLLADLGAEVIVIHRPDGENNPVKQGPALLDRGKRSIALDLKDAKDRPVIEALLRSADGLIEGMRPGVMERLNLGPDIVHALNSKLVYGRMTGWGQTGPRAQQAGHDLNYLALSGALFYASPPGQPPVAPPTLTGDLGGGAMYLCVGMLAGLLKARQSGQGCVVDAAIVDGVSHLFALLLSMGPMFDPAARGGSLLDGPHWSRCYTCADGGFVSVQCLEQKFYHQFLTLLGLESDPDMQDQFDAAQWSTQSARLAALFATQPRSHWEALFDGTDACVAPVLSPSEAAQDPHHRARGLWNAKGPTPAPRFDGTVAQPGPIPARDAHRDPLLDDLTERGLL